MEIIKIHYKVSKPVVKWQEIENAVYDMTRFIVRGAFKGLYNKAFALTHSQVCETPMSFFVVAPECVAEKMFEKQVIINPVIITADKHHKIDSSSPDELAKFGLTEDKAKTTVVVPNTRRYSEPCMSFPFRKPKLVERYNVIEVEYQIKGVFGLKTIRRRLSGIASEIFQHCVELTQGKNIYFESETPVKWWELVGNEKSKGGTSLDAPDDLKLVRTKENPRV